LAQPNSNALKNSPKSKKSRLPISALLDLSHEFGRAGLIILGEGNTSCRIDDKTFVVKASGSNLTALTKLQLTRCYFEKLLPALDRKAVPEQEIEDILLDSRVKKTALKPSVETFFHAYLLTLPSVNYVGHTHAIPINQILCTSAGKEFAEQRRFPDEVVCCGPRSLLIPYEDPGLTLAKRIRQDVEEFTQKHGKPPRVILLQNHGIITIGQSIDAVRVAMMMAVKAAQIFIGAHQLGNVNPMPPSEVERIENRLDEEYRRKMLRM
jgi:rhamnose utilization protein RhaD (predicted bifunctional aldolase and dehydrogenase)